MAGPRRRRCGPGPAPHRIAVRFTEEEFQAVRAAAGTPAPGVTVGRFVAEAALVAIGQQRPRTTSRGPTRLALAEITQAAAQVARIGNNLNQLARERNSTGTMPAGTFEEVERARLALEDLVRIVERAGQPP